MNNRRARIMAFKASGHAASVLIESQKPIDMQFVLQQDLTSNNGEGVSGNKSINQALIGTSTMKSRQSSTSY